MYLCLFFIDLWWNPDCTRVRKDGIICEGAFIYAKTSKHLELISFLIGYKNPIINNLLDVKKLSVFVTMLQQSSIFLERKHCHTSKKDSSKRSKGIIVCNFCCHIFIIINFSLQLSLQRENFAILKNSLLRELW